VVPRAGVECEQREASALGASVVGGHDLARAR
jgi:hypothetical protein